MATVGFRHLPNLVPVHFNASGEADRWLAPKAFIALMVGMTASLGGLLAFARWIIAQPAYDPDGRYTRHPLLRTRTLVVLDLGGAAGISLITWTAFLCVEASRMPVPSLNRLALLLPLIALLVGLAGGFWWLRQARRE